AGFLVALRMKGETSDEVIGFARSMRAHCVQVKHEIKGEPVLDTCGTGGDGSCTFNISTIAALVIAGAGVKVAKHGNRSISSLCGSADILEGLGVNIALTAEQMGRCLREVGIAFLFAPTLHPAMRHAQPARKELKLRTVFNLLGPLTNPAGANVQLVGAPSIRAAELMAEALGVLGVQRAFIVHGLDGLDEITTAGETLALEIRGGAIAHHTLTPADFGLSAADPLSLKGDDPETNCGIARAVLEGAPGPQRDIVLANASAGLVAAGKAQGFTEGVELAARSIDSGAARTKLDELARFTTALVTAA
ncbi:MAG TPA: anthranilate phosphoribosyltransferase, partial [Bryobacteraceae bacterium]|nr:anthranilate phosphoribosyltransferase [Bryobacteraceae bacterium]